ncbi:MAG: hypothetical protein JO180_07675 [Gemmatirosa sp.]|nr:hypothetical protein [Gemmatirosa sp.]
MRLVVHSRMGRAAGARRAVLLGAGSALAGSMLAACGPAEGGGKAAAAAPVACRASVEDAVAAAVGAYVKQATPKPQRFLVAVGTDSALGDAGTTALQDKGPTYLFPGDPALQANVRTQLHDKGDYTTLLVVRHAASAKAGEASVALAGHYVGGDEDGKPAGPRTYALSCDSTTWHVRPSTTPEPHT